MLLDLVQTHGGKNYVKGAYTFAIKWSRCVLMAFPPFLQQVVQAETIQGSALPALCEGKPLANGAFESPDASNVKIFPHHEGIQRLFQIWCHTK